MKKIISGLAIAACFLASCASKTTSVANSGDSTATILKRNTDAAMNSEMAFSNRNVDSAFKDYAKGFIEYGNSGSKPMKNVDSMKINTKLLFAAFPDFKGTNLHATAQDSTVIVVGDWSGTFKGEYMKIKPTNKSFKVTDADIFTFNSAGKITSHRSIQSDITFLHQLDITLPKKK